MGAPNCMSNPIWVSQRGCHKGNPRTERSTSIADFFNGDDALLYNALVQVQAHYHQCGEAASEKCCLLQHSLGGGSVIRANGSPRHTVTRASHCLDRPLAAQISEYSGGVKFDICVGVGVAPAM